MAKVSGLSSSCCGSAVKKADVCKNIASNKGEVLPLRVYETQGITLNPLMYIIISTTVNFFGGVIVIKTGSGDFSGTPEMM